ncbi:g patch domain and KOW [Seminavis robusta]|uniref:G patch domain and KOW n=1 Tax=Seminavis robusta TaxID=568900 RepID=A0A9N8E0P4_9STRA|nr:g patch domain and KOW [Seminavis robusta]|eukprot:Sro533_g161610.1 g patch domain and KOW (647) ;mRNA; r:19017-20957
MTNGKVAFSLGGKKKKKTSSSNKEVSARDFGHATEKDDDNGEEIRSFDGTEVRDVKEPLVIPLTQPANTLVDRIRQELQGKQQQRQQQRENNGVKQEDTSDATVKQEGDNGDVKDEEVLEAVLSSANRNNATNGGGQAAGPVISSSDNVTSAARITSNNNNNNNNIKDHLERELEELPDEADDEAYEKIPIDQFGAALLRGMGWNESAEQKPQDSNQMMGSIPRPSRLGLGAIPKAPGGVGNALDMPSVLTGRNKNKKKKLTDNQKRQQEEFEKQRELQKKQDKQQTRQIGSIVYLLDEDNDNDANNNNNTGSRKRKRAKLVQLMGVPGLNMALAQLEGQAEPTSIKKGKLGPLVPRSELAQEPFVLPKPRPPKDDNKRDERSRRDRSPEDRRRRDRSRSTSPDRQRKDDRKSDRKRKERDDDRDRSRSPRDDPKSDRRRDRRDRERDDRDYSRDKKKRRDRDEDDRRRDDKYNGKRRRRDDSGSGSESDRDKRKRKDSRRDEGDKKRSSNSRHDNKSSDSPMWIIPNIRVRVVTEKLGRRYFRQKGVIVDVTRKHGATLRMDMLDGGKDAVLEHVPERYLETALPKSGGNVIVLTGKHKWTKGRLIERNGKTAKGSLQVFEDMSILTLSLDDMAEWCGSLDDDLG